MDMKNGIPSACKIQTFIFFDLETTDLIRGSRMPKITEMSLVAVSRDAIVTKKRDSPPRVLHKLVIPLCPMRPIPPEVSNLTDLTIIIPRLALNGNFLCGVTLRFMRNTGTFIKVLDSTISALIIIPRAAFKGLDNYMLDTEKPLDNDVYVMLTVFLKRLSPPVCFVAHHGNGFDYPILIEELRHIGKGLPNSILCVDSKIGFKDLLLSIDEIDQPGKVEQFDESTEDAHPSDTTSIDDDYKTSLNMVDHDYISLLNDDFNEALAVSVDAIDFKHSTPKQDCDNSTFHEVPNPILEAALGTPSTSKVMISKTNPNIDLTGIERSPKRNGLNTTMQEINEKTPSQQIIAAGTMNPHKIGKRKEKAIRRKRLPFTLSRPINYCLTTIHEHLIGIPPQVAHSAEADCLTMLRCVMHIGDRFVSWADLNAVPLMNCSRVAKYRC